MALSGFPGFATDGLLCENGLETSVKWVGKGHFLRISESIGNFIVLVYQRTFEGTSYIPNSRQHHSNKRVVAGPLNVIGFRREQGWWLVSLDCETGNRTSEAGSHK